MRGNASVLDHSEFGSHGNFLGNKKHLLSVLGEIFQERGILGDEEA